MKNAHISENSDATIANTMNQNFNQVTLPGLFMLYLFSILSLSALLKECKTDMVARKSIVITTTHLVSASD